MPKKHLTHSTSFFDKISEERGIAGMHINIIKAIYEKARDYWAQVLHVFPKLNISFFPALALQVW
jgi:hypothetical protein